MVLTCHHVPVPIHNTIRVVQYWKEAVKNLVLTHPTINIK